MNIFTDPASLLFNLLESDDENDGIIPIKKGLGNYAKEYAKYGLNCYSECSGKHADDYLFSYQCSPNCPRWSLKCDKPVKDSPKVKKFKEVKEILNEIVNAT